MAEDTFAARHGNMAVFHFQKANVAQGLTNTDLVLSGTLTDNTLVPMPGAGHLKAVALKLNDDVTAQTLVCKVHLSGTEYAEEEAPTATLDTTNVNADYGLARPGAVTFVAGAELGLSITTGAGFLPTGSADLDAWLYVGFEPK
jgi:hypothetical protein